MENEGFTGRERLACFLLITLSILFFVLNILMLYNTETIILIALFLVYTVCACIFILVCLEENEKKKTRLIKTVVYVVFVDGVLGLSCGFMYMIRVFFLS